MMKYGGNVDGTRDKGNRRPKQPYITPSFVEISPPR
jgi:hypothetical protein